MKWHKIQADKRLAFDRVKHVKLVDYEKFLGTKPLSYCASSIVILVLNRCF